MNIFIDLYMHLHIHIVFYKGHARTVDSVITPLSGEVGRWDFRWGEIAN